MILGTEPETERAWWDLLQMQNPESMVWKIQFDRAHSVIGNHLRDIYGGLRNCIAMCSQYAEGGPIPDGYYDALNGIHPRALRLIAQHGVEFCPLPPSHHPGGEPIPRACYGNAWFQMHLFNQEMRKEGKTSRLTYVEGVALGSRSEPVLHAWNTLGTNGTHAFDWSWYAVTGWTYYIGIPLTEHQHARLRTLAYPDSGFHLLFKTEVFPKIQTQLEAILQRRKVPC